MSGYSSTDTFASLIDETIVSLQGWGVNTDQMASLSAAITSTDTSIQIDDPGTSRGIYEVDEELMWAQGASNGLLIVPSWGRGWKGTAAAAHAAGSAVYINPLYPRSIVSREVRNTIRATYPALFGVGTYEFLVTGTTFQYDMPADVEGVIDVDWKYDMTVTGWRKVRGWDLTFNASPTDFPTSGKALSLNDVFAPGVSVRVRYAKRPVLPSSPADTFTSTGLPESARDVVVYGAASRLLPFMDAGRLPVDTVMSDQQDAVKPVGNAISVARELRSLYTKRLLEERTALLEKYPIRQHLVR